MSTKLVKTPSEAIDALGGTSEVARILGKSKQSVSNWRQANRLPPEIFLHAIKALRAEGYDAKPELFGIRSSEDAA